MIDIVAASERMRPVSQTKTLGAPRNGSRLDAPPVFPGLEPLAKRIKDISCDEKDVVAYLADQKLVVEQMCGNSCGIGSAFMLVRGSSNDHLEP